MRELSAAWRNLGMDAILLALLMLLYEGLDPFSDRSPMARVVRIVLATVLLIGIVPGSYLHSLVSRLSVRVEKAPRWVVFAFAVIFPLLALILFAWSAYDFAFILEETPGVVFYVLVSVLQAVVLVLNLLLIRNATAKGKP